MFQQILQAIVHGVTVGAVVALPAIGLTLIFSVLGYINFSIAGMMTVGAFAGWWANLQWHLPALACVPVALAATGLLGIVVDRLAIRPLRTRRSPDTPMMVAIATIALNLILENATRFVFGNDLRSYDMPMMRDVELLSLSVNPQQLANVGVALVVMVLLFGFIGFTSLGQAMRAIADNLELARLKGIRPERLTVLTTFLGCGIAGAGGVLLGSDTSVDPLLGSRLVLMVFAASVVGGLNSIPGAVLGAMFMGVAGELATLVVSPTYSSAVAFIAILVTLLYRPHGLMGKAR